jgi:hypothetical protein
MNMTWVGHGAGYNHASQGLIHLDSSNSKIQGSHQGRLLAIATKMFQALPVYSSSRSQSPGHPPPSPKMKPSGQIWPLFYSLH